MTTSMLIIQQKYKQEIQKINMNMKSPFFIYLKVNRLPTGRSEIYGMVYANITVFIRTVQPSLNAVSHLYSISF